MSSLGSQLLSKWSFAGPDIQLKRIILTQGNRNSRSIHIVENGKGTNFVAAFLINRGLVRAGILFSSFSVCSMVPIPEGMVG